MSDNILSAVRKLVLIDLTNQREVLCFQQELIQEGRELYNYHAVNHNEFCDCREYQRTLSLFRVIFNYLYQLIRNNNF